MLKEHAALLDKIEGAEKAALALLNSGQKVDSIIQKLRAASADVRQRISYLKDAEEDKVKAKAEAAKPKAPTPEPVAEKK